MSEKIDFFIIGAQKAGTTSIYEYLKSIDSISMPLVKEMQVFTKEKLYRDFPKNISSFYENNIAHSELVGMADVEILYSYKLSAQRLFNYNPDGKIIIMLRNPIERAYSSYWFSRKNQRENISTFEEAIHLEDERKKTLNQNDRLALTYLDVSMYYKQVKAFLDIYGKDKVSILIMEEFKCNKEKEFNKLLDFLEIDKNNFNKNILNKKFNEGGDVKSKIVQKFFNHKNILRNFYSLLFSLKLRMKIRNKIINPLLSINKKPFRYEKMPESTKNKVKEYLLEDVLKLSKLLDKDLVSLWF